MKQESRTAATLRAYSDWIIPTGAVALVFVMLVPLPSIVLDLLLTLSITASVLVLLTAIQVLRPVEFSVFPSLILLLTLMRLALDLASNAAHPAARQRRPVGRRQSHRGLRAVRGRRQLHCRLRHLSSRSSLFNIWSSATARCAPLRSPPASLSMPCPANRWQSTPT